MPGSAIKDNTVQVHDNTIEYRMEPKETIIGINNRPEIRQPVISLNHPNPFHETTRVLVSCAQSSRISLFVTNLMGQKILSADKGLVKPGTIEFVVDGSTLAPGVYIYTVSIDDERFTGKMIRE